MKRADSIGLQLAQLVALAVGVEHRQPRLRGPERHLLVLPFDARRQDLVLQRVLALGQLGADDAALAGLAQSVEALELVRRGAVSVRCALGLGQSLELRTREEIAVAGDDRRLLGGLLLPHPDGARLLEALVEEAGKPCLEGVGAANLVFAHGLDSIGSHRGVMTGELLGKRSGRTRRCFARGVRSGAPRCSGPGPAVPAGS